MGFIFQLYLQQPVERDDLNQEEGEVLKHRQHAKRYPVR